MKSHGHTRGRRFSPTYMSWVAMRARCLNKNADNYKRYGGSGIRICKRWNSFELFLSDMGERPNGRTIDRIRNSGGYKPSNCKWSTPKEQALNSNNEGKGWGKFRTHCSNGHEWREANTHWRQYLRRGKIHWCRSCRICAASSAKKKRALARV